MSMRSLCALAGCGLFGLLAGTLATSFGQTVTQTETTTRVIRISQVLGSGVTLQEGIAYGKVTDFVLTDAGCIDYLVVAYEDSFVVVPWTFATVDFEQRIVRLDVTREQLRSVTFARDAWQSASAAQLTGRMRTAFGDRARHGEGEHRSHFQSGRDGGNRDSRQVQPGTDREPNNAPSERGQPNPAGERGRPRPEPPRQTRPADPAPSPQPERRPPAQERDRNHG
jgi:PRC-barrel domain